jgi:hypothetical protein
MEELDRFYDETDIEPPSQRVPQIAAALFQEPKAAYALLIWEGSSLSVWLPIHSSGLLRAASMDTPRCPAWRTRRA